MRLLIDTNIFVSILNEEENYFLSKSILENIHKGKYLGATTAICVAEVLSGFYFKGEVERGERFLTDLSSINNFEVLVFDIKIAKEAARLRSKYGLKLPDAIIVATCEVYDYILVTKDETFYKIKEIQVKKPGELG